MTDDSVRSNCHQLIHDPILLGVGLIHELESLAIATKPQ
jgi:hypothetical protein